MFTLPKLNKKGSARHQIAIKGVEDSVLLLPNNEYRVIIETSSINFHLMSENEQDAVVDIYKAFLNSLSFPIQILQKVRALDLDDYLQSFEDKKKSETVEVYKNQIDGYTKYVKSLVKTNKILSRQFYIVIPYHTKGKEDLEIAREQLANRLAIVEKGLGNVGIKTRLLSSLELLDLFYSSYNSTDAKQQPLTQQTIDLLQKNYF
ncbi:MAG: Type secretory pathway VirB4 protein [Candidatus Saccharibacteria bacterium]|nr:Type secretory pathway VirB4 protein [Candidatus Saccharibacteria bacterium]